MGRLELQKGINYSLFYNPLDLRIKKIVFRPCNYKPIQPNSIKPVDYIGHYKM